MNDKNWNYRHLNCRLKLRAYPGVVVSGDFLELVAVSGEWVGFAGEGRAVERNGGRLVLKDDVEVLLLAAIATVPAP